MLLVKNLDASFLSPCPKHLSVPEDKILASVRFVIFKASASKWIATFISLFTGFIIAQDYQIHPWSQSPLSNYHAKTFKDIFGDLQLLRFKACVCYFLSNFYFFIKWQAFKIYEKCFYFIWKALFVLEIFNFCNFFPFHIFQIQKGKWKWNNLRCHKLACINL